MVKMYLSKLAPFWISTQPTDTPWQPFISDQANIGPKLNWRETTTLKMKPYNLGDLSKNYFVSSPLLNDQMFCWKTFLLTAMQTQCSSQQESKYSDVGSVLSISQKAQSQHPSKYSTNLIPIQKKPKICTDFFLKLRSFYDPPLQIEKEIWWPFKMHLNTFSN